ncbi:Glycosyltransferase involved in cell wall bisynthesis [Malonomonas rubra DSM 5091]|uniref:Glycosyltransferase involved in cell wall bisynthesis n=1 Tax=Malonomonas rubra DSM 5091 TaxID=1122189 RepID=A0A1M6DR81_MALRU|nr:glycosyltransferase [Malonomonas rubra]SHI75722.1 Glycosyltransferase involved in cell wall bisynthesis [Malonomonas rubra DSM 5091]
MKIAYVLVEELHPGLQNKIFGQIGEWEVQGHEVVLISHKTGRVFRRNGEKLFADPGLGARDHQQLVRKNRLARLGLFRKQYSFLESALSKVRPDLTYGRYPFPFLGVTRAYSAGAPYVFEINSDDVSEYYIKHRFTGVYNQVFRKAVLSGAAGMVFVTGELAESDSFRWYTGARLVLGNSVCVADFPFVENPENSQPNICFIGTPKQKWHGLDKIGAIAEALPDVQIHVIGPEPEQYRDSGGAVYDNMVFHGYLNDQDAKRVVAKMDVGISTLALHEKNMDEACPLKARQYFAQGLPVIAGYKETDISTAPFFLQLPNSQDNVKDNLNVIKEFIQRVYGDCELRCQAREFAEKVLDVKSKEVVRLDFMRKLVAHG